MLCTKPFGVHRAEHAVTGMQVEAGRLIPVWHRLSTPKHSPGCEDRAFPAEIPVQPCGLKQQLLPGLEPVVQGGGGAAPLPMAQARFWYLHSGGDL